jgi:GT2 family glycosyltransferase
VECENHGFGYANNSGAKYAKGKYLFLLNPDTILLNNAIKILADFLDKNPKVGICGGNLFDENRCPNTSYFMHLPSVKCELYSFFGRWLEKLRYGKNAYFNHNQQPRKVGYTSGADLMIRTDLFDSLNGFDIEFFVYYEETELTYRVKKAGYEVYNIAQAEIIHLEGKSFSNDEYKQKLILNGRRIYYKKTHTRFATRICDGIYLSAIFLRCFLFGVIGNKKRFRNAKSIFKNITS